MARILIIDDEPSILNLLKRILTIGGHEVLTACDGAEGLQIAQDQQVQAILSDLSMPGTPSGMDLLAAIRKLRPDCPLAVVSGYNSSDCAEDCRRIGITDFLPKPFEIAFVRSFVNNLIARTKTNT